MPHSPTLIIGGGLAGLSAAYHLGHNQTVILEAADNPFGLVGSEIKNGFTWDQGPHVSFTEQPYVRELFKDSAEGLLVETPVKVGNRYGAHWIDHPAQTNLYQVPEPLRSKCLNGFLENIKHPHGGALATYRDWLESAFGTAFTDAFPAKYTRKYWTVEPESMSTEWVGSRVLRPSTEDVTQGAKRPLKKNLHYIKTIRYPLHGGYQTFAQKLAANAKIQLATRVTEVDLANKSLKTQSGETWTYDRLISTMVF